MCERCVPTGRTNLARRRDLVETSCCLRVPARREYLVRVESILDNARVGRHAPGGRKVGGAAPGADAPSQDRRPDPLAAERRAFYAAVGSMTSSPNGMRHKSCVGCAGSIRERHTWDTAVPSNVPPIVSAPSKRYPRRAPSMIGVNRSGRSHRTVNCAS
jgi:hypothetical protein